tara:strand:- start:419 stop:1288 length:870 start_codon:yes stop_codon:yes gene_type:complete
MILIVGKDGFLGANLYLRLHSLSQDVVFLSKKNQAHANKNSEVITYEYFLKHIVEYTTKVKIIVYLLPPDSLYDNSINILNFVIENMWIKNKAKFIYVSSGGAIYGNTENQPILENQKTDPIDDYGHSKLREELTIRDAGGKYMLNWNILRPSNPIGKYQSESLLLKIFENNLSKTNIYLHDRGEQIRDFFSIGALIDAIFIVINDNKNQCEIFNVGSGKGTKIKDFTSDVLKICDMSNVDSVLINKNKLSITKNILNCSKIYKKLGWKDNTSLHTSILDAWNHFKKNN